MSRLACSSQATASRKPSAEELTRLLAASREECERLRARLAQAASTSDTFPLVLSRGKMLAGTHA